MQVSPKIWILITITSTCST